MKAEILAASTEKLNGRFYTPEFIVNNVLDLSGYRGRAILKKHVIDNSCGDGAFLVAIADRYCNEFLKTDNDLKRLSEELSLYLHGIDIDEFEKMKCIENLNNAVRQYGLDNIKWDIICADTMSVEKYNGKMDFVIGNPPYIRVHNLGTSFNRIKKFAFAQSGMTDLYIVFFEIGIKMLNSSGILGYITPSSFFNSLAGKYMRRYFVNNNLLDKIIDLKHFQAFAATTYTAITILNKNRNNSAVDYYRFDEKNYLPYYVDTLSADDYYICDSFYFADKERLNELKNILSFNSYEDHFVVKNGFATLADSFFIGDFDFDEFTIPIVKASTGKRYKCIFPYSKGKLVPFEDLTANSDIKKYFETYKDVGKTKSGEKQRLVRVRTDARN